MNGTGNAPAGESLMQAQLGAPTARGQIGSQVSATGGSSRPLDHMIGRAQDDVQTLVTICERLDAALQRLGIPYHPQPTEAGVDNAPMAPGALNELSALQMQQRKLINLLSDVMGHLDQSV